ncbi:MAG: hypothetical protein IT406_02855 [Candidatus Yanofskybacteria bacterium]|nr:hypothetical protein [Candidatus Yanofskybacteria bacterium]
MKCSRGIALVLAGFVCSCGSSWNVAAPSSVAIGQSPRSATASPEGAVIGSRNRGTQVWMNPPPAGDLIRAVGHPELWAETQKRVDVFAIYFVQAYWHEGYECGNACGPNHYQALRDAGAFRSLSERFTVAMEAPAVKEWSCTPELITNQIALPVAHALDLVQEAGGTVSYISVDESFAMGTNGYQGQSGPFGPSVTGCGLAPDAVAALLKLYVDTIHERHPEVQIGFIEPYPHFSPDQIISFLLELERAKVPIPYFHLDMHLKGGVRRREDMAEDLRRVREFCAARNIPFGVIIFGEDGTSNQQFAADAWAVTQMVASAVGVTEHTVLQSWAEDPPGDLNSIKHVPDIVPESDPSTMSGLLLQILKFLKIDPA